MEGEWTDEGVDLQLTSIPVTSLGVNPGTSLATLSQFMGWGTPHREPSTMSRTRTLLSYGKLLLSEQKRLISTEGRETRNKRAKITGRSAGNELAAILIIDEVVCQTFSSHNFLTFLLFLILCDKNKENKRVKDILIGTMDHINIENNSQLQP